MKQMKSMGAPPTGWRPVRKPCGKSVVEKSVEYTNSMGRSG